MPFFLAEKRSWRPGKLFGCLTETQPHHEGRYWRVDRVMAMTAPFASTLVQELATPSTRLTSHARSLTFHNNVIFVFGQLALVSKAADKTLTLASRDINFRRERARIRRG
jgi:hypothetical protein